MVQKSTSKFSLLSSEEKFHLINQSRAKIRSAWGKYEKSKTYENYLAYMNAKKRYRKTKLEMFEVVPDNVTSLFKDTQS